MRLVSYCPPGLSPTFGALSDDMEWVSDLKEGSVTTLKGALSTWGVDGIAQRARQGRYQTRLSDVRLMTPIPDPGKILCVGLNYASHTSETSYDAPQQPSLFVRFPESFVAHEEPVLMPTLSAEFDYEAELAIVIGSRAYQVDEADAMTSVAGYACLAENSVRDYQKHSRQATAGKNFYRSGAWGPYLTTADAVATPDRLTVIGRLNGEVLQQDTTDHLVFAIPKLIAYISSFIPLEAGDVIATGTPAGVGCFRDPPVYMRPGDTFEVEIPSVGLLRNQVAA